jgi:UDP-N-acetylglucosamine 2-epimerase (non-hydrolysing)
VDVVCVAGARPNFMKVAPVIAALEGVGAAVRLCHTGQHYDPEMSDTFFAELGIRRPDVSFDVGPGTAAEQTGAVMVGFERLLHDHPTDVVVVVGDVTSTMACAIVAAKAGVLLAHVEAGLRSRDWSMPEEVNRVITDRVSDLLLAPSDDAVANLRAEGARDDQIHLVGNVMVDTLVAHLDAALDRPLPAGLSAGGYGVVTLHRPSNVDDAASLATMLSALGDVATQLPLVFPCHPRTRHALEGIELPPGLGLLPPLGYLDFLGLQARAALVLTDSGGVQEESTVLGVPCLTLRHTTERPITVTEGTNRVVGTDPAAIVAAARDVLSNPPTPRRPALWDGRAGERIAAAIDGVWRGRAGWARPTALP